MIFDNELLVSKSTSKVAFNKGVMTGMKLVSLNGVQIDNVLRDAAANHLTASISSLENKAQALLSRIHTLGNSRSPAATSPAAARNLDQLLKSAEDRHSRNLDRSELDQQSPTSLLKAILEQGDQAFEALKQSSSPRGGPAPPTAALEGPYEYESDDEGAHSRGPATRLELGNPDHPSNTMSPVPYSSHSELRDMERDELAHWRKICCRSPDVLRGLRDEKRFLLAKLHSRPGTESKADWHRKEMEQIEMVLLEHDLESASAFRGSDSVMGGSPARGCSFEAVTNFFYGLAGFENTTEAEPTTLLPGRSGVLSLGDGPGSLGTSQGGGLYLLGPGAPGTGASPLL